MPAKYSKRAPPDLLDELLGEETKNNPSVPSLVKAAVERRVFARRLANKRKRLGLSQTQIAQRMGSTQRVVSRLENGGDVQVSTLARYVEAIGFKLELHASRRRAKAA